MTYLPQNFAADCSLPSFFGLDPWYKYLLNDSCTVVFELTTDNGAFTGRDILLAGLGIIDILIRITALAAVAFVMYGGIKYITSQGSPEGTKGAQKTIINALAGLAITITAAALVSFIGKTFGA